MRRADGEEAGWGSVAVLWWLSQATDDPTLHATLGLLAVAGAFDDLATEAVDLVGRHGAEIIVQLLAGFELLAVDQQGPGPAERVAVLVEVAEQFEAAILKCG